MTTYIQHANETRLVDGTGFVHDRLLPGNYTVKYRREQYYLEACEQFDVPSRVYGDHMRRAERIMHTFKNRDVNTGVMLTGLKGSGKSLMAKTLANMCFKLDIPVIIVNAAHYGDDFNTFIQRIDQPCMVLFDEFEKVYDREDQDRLLTLFDGVVAGKKLFVITCNKPHSVNEYIVNRPGRFHYRIDYGQLDEAFIVDYCNENLKDKSQIADICRYSSLFNDFNFDMLKALVSEMNMYDEPLREVVKLINVRPESAFDMYHMIEIWENGTAINMPAQEWYGNPIQENVYISVENRDFRFMPTDIVSVDRRAGVYEYQQGDLRMRVTENKKNFDFSKAF